MLSFSALLDSLDRRLSVFLRTNVLSNDEAANQTGAGADQTAIDQSSQPTVFTPVFNISRIPDLITNFGSGKKIQPFQTLNRGRAHTACDWQSAFPGESRLQ